VADSKIDTLDVGALERSVNDSAGRVSTIWLSFVAFSAYAAAAASTTSHRQLLLEDPIKLPTINIDVPLVVAAILLPSLFVIYHVYVLLQVVLLARTAAAYNDAVERNIADEADRARIRQRLANTLFAQLFAGSSREREGVLGWLLRLMAWITLAIAPVLVLIVFELRFLPYHSALVTWTQRALLAIDLLAVLTLWAGAVDARRDIAWQGLMKSWKVTLGGAVVVAICCVLLTFPGEPTRYWMRFLPATDETASGAAQCRLPWLVAEVFAANFDRLSLPGEDFVDDDKLAKIRSSADAKDQKPFEGERTRNFRARDLSCGNFSGADLRNADLTGARMAGARFDGAKLQAVRLAGAQLRGASLFGTLLQGSDLTRADLRGARLNSAQLQGSVLDDADLQRAALNGASVEGGSLERAKLRGATLDGARLAGVSLAGAELQGASLAATQLQGANLHGAKFIGARVHGTKLQGARLNEASLQGADLYGVDLAGATLHRAALQGATIRSARLTAAIFEEAQLQGARFESPLRYTVIARSFLWQARHHGCRDAWVIDPRLDEVIEVTYARTLELTVKPTAEEIAKFIERKLEGLPPDFKPEDAGKLRAGLQSSLSADPGKPRSGSSPQTWLDCAKEAAKLSGDEDHQQAAVDLGALACPDGPGSPHLARAIYAHWIGNERLNESGRKLLAVTLLGSKESPCPGAAGLDGDTRDALRALVEKKPGEN
jgi:uncharacterized protein YjbI with pentapeptide repeats